MKKKFLFITLLVALFTLFAFTSSAKATSNENVYGTVTSLSGSPTISDDDNGNIVITFTKTQINNLKWTKHDDNGIERGMNGWWLGFRVTAPENADLDTSLWSSGQTVNKPFRQSLDSSSVRYCSYWVPLDETILANHDEEWTAYKYTFNWKNRADAQEPEVKTLNVTIKIDPEGVVLNTTPENPENAGKIIKVTIDGQIFRILKGETLNSLPTAEKTRLNNLKFKDGFTFAGFFKTVDGEEIEVKETDPINEDTVLTSKFTKIETPPTQQEDPKPEEPAETPAVQEEPKDETPKTGSVNIELIFTVIALIAVLGIIIIRKFK